MSNEQDNSPKTAMKQILEKLAEARAETFVIAMEIGGELKYGRLHTEDYREKWDMELLSAQFMAANKKVTAALYAWATALCMEDIYEILFQLYICEEEATYEDEYEGTPEEFRISQKAALEKIDYIESRLDERDPLKLYERCLAAFNRLNERPD